MVFGRFFGRWFSHSRKCSATKELQVYLRHGPRLRAPSRVQHHAQDAVDAEPGVPEAYDHIPRFRGRPSNGERCDVCEVLIADTVIEGIPLEVTRRKLLQMHVRCFALWDEIRNEPRS